MLGFTPLFPPRASTTADLVDGLLYFLLATTGVVVIGVILTMLVFITRYRRRSSQDRTPRILGSTPLELFWTITPFFVFIAMFIWGASVYNYMVWPPDGADQVYVVGKQWMWKVQHADGQREINELHLPVGRPVRLMLTSEDVIHDFFVPAFRTKVDVLPGRYVQTWYLPNQVGEYHLFCSQYCGTSHANMIGKVFVMREADYEAWLNNRAEGSLALQGRQLFLKLECISCHSADAHARAPVLEGLYGRTIPLSNGTRVVADEAYIRESILDPRAKVVQGWDPIMPTFKGQVSEEDIFKLIAFIKSLKPGGTPNRNEEFPAPVGAPTRPEERKEKE